MLCCVVLCCLFRSPTLSALLSAFLSTLLSALPHLIPPTHCNDPPVFFHQVRITPIDSNDNLITDVEYIGGTKDGDISTTCGCLSSDPTGKPTDFELRQERGLVLFSWTDRSHCESGFTFFRDGVTLSSSYDVTSEESCAGEHEPLQIYDDLALQKEGACASVCVCVCGSGR